MPDSIETGPAAKGPKLRSSDWVVVAYLVVESVLLLLFGRGREPLWPCYLAIHAAMIAGVFLLVRLPSSSGPGRILRDWYPALYIVLVFKQLGALVPAVHPRTFDDALLAWDVELFGRHPGEWFDAIASPLVTEVMRACWLSYFVIPFVVALPLYRRPDRGPFREAVFALVLGWLVSFLGYYIVPALGPGYFPEKVPAPESVTGAGATQSVALALFALEGRVHDIFPSGHTIIALLGLWLAARHRVRGWPLLVPVVAGLVAGTVYLRYHYGVDVLAGFAIAGAVVLVCAGRTRRLRPRGRGGALTSRASP